MRFTSMGWGSRTNDGGGDPWAHPFIGYHGDTPVLAYVANGAPGYFKPRAAEYKVLVESLLAEGYGMYHLPHTDNKPYMVLSDGSHVHMSDAMCQLIYKNIKSGMPSREALASAFATMPGEIAGLLLSPDVQDGVVFARINMPIFVAYAPHGVYL